MLRLTRVTLLAVGFVILVPSLLFAQTAQPVPRKYVPGRVLVKFRPTVQPTAIRAAHLAAAGHVMQSFSSVEGLQLVQVAASTKLSEALAAYRANPDVLYAEPDYIVHAFQTPNDPLFPTMWSLLNTGQNGGTLGADIKATLAWSITTGSSNVVIAVIDSGVDYNHPDLAANIFTGPICPGGVVCHGINAVEGSILSTNDPFDDNGHGTHVSGTIGAIGNNALGVTGINWNVTLLPCKFLGADGSGAASGAIQCLDFIKSLKDSGLNIVASNNSWGGGDFSQALQDAIDRQRQSGILFIAAAGNDFSDNDVRPSYPASFPLPNIIAVAATDRNDNRPFFSNIGRHSVHLGAPGQDILSTLPGGTYGLDSGTSMATPHVTGVAALLAAQDPTRDWRAIKNLILAGGDLNTAMASTISGRRLNAFNSLTCTNSVVSGRLLPTADTVSGAVGVPLTLAALNINCAQPNGPVQVTVTPGGQTIQLTDDGVGPDLSAGDGVYTGSFTPASTGVYTLTFSTGGTSTVQVLNNYEAGNTDFNYRTIAGTNLNLADDGVAQIAAPFPILFGDGSFDQLWISANGTISFTGAVSSYLHMPLPTGAPFHSSTPLVIANTLVAPFWDDLLPQPGTAQNVFWDVTGTAPNRELVVEWRNLQTFDCLNEPDTVKFQAVFFENSSNILFNYADTVFGGSCVRHDHGLQASEGVQVSDKVGASWGFEGEDITDGEAILWKTSTAVVTTPPTPTITSISPTTVIDYGPPLTLTVNGSNFTPDSRVVLGAFSRPTAFISSTQLTAQILPTDLDPFAFILSTGLTPVLVQTRLPGLLLESNTATLTIATPTPTITSFDTPSAPAGSFGFILTVTGSDFVPFSTVNWNGQPLISVTFSRTEVQGFITGNLLLNPGIVSITVTNPNGGTSTPLPFTITAGGPAPPAAAPLSYRIQQTPTSRSISTAKPDIRSRKFFGWNFARQQGQAYMQQFIRPYGGLFTASKEQAAAPNLSALALGTSPALAGLDLPEPLASGFLPSGVAAGDFNHDGHIDWVVSNAGSNNLWLYLGNGDGTAQLPRIINLNGSTPIAIAAVDLRGTGNLDLVLAEPDSLSVGVLLGNGDGTFAPEQLYFSPAPPLCITVNDFNRDGHPDVVVGLTGENPTGAVAFFAGDGTGKLLPPVTTPLDREFSPATFVFAITSGDLNNDGVPDLAVTDQNAQEPGTFVYLGQGDGTFKKGQNLGGILNAAIGDINNDGCQDVVTIDTFGFAAAMLGHCDGTFQIADPLGFFGEGEIGVAMALADVNGDGKLDFITSGINIGGGIPGVGQESGSLVSVALGDGTGAFEPARVYHAQSAMFGLAMADLNGDLHPDIVVVSQDTDSTLVLLNDGTGRFGGFAGRYIGFGEKGQATNFLQGPANAPFSMLAVDLDGDGKKDLVSVDLNAFALPANLVISMNDGTGNFLPDKKIPVLDQRFLFLGNMIAGDFRGTGHPDIILTPNHISSSFTGNFYVFIPNLGAGNFGTPVTTNITGLPGVIAQGDFNGDGKLDFVMAGGTATNQIQTFLGNGNGTFTPIASQPFTGTPQNLLVGDFNGDGKLDVIMPLGGQLVEFPGNGDGTFAPPKIAISGVLSFSDISVQFETVDVNHDGRMDLIQRSGNQDGPIPVFNIYLAQPDGSFILQNSYSPYSGQPFTNPFLTPGQHSFVGDFNGDGIPDIAAFQMEAALPARTYVQFLLGNGDGTFTPTFEKFPLGARGTAVPNIVTDMNNDGKADFVELDGFSSSFSMILSTTGHPFQIQFASLPVIGATGQIHASIPVQTAQDTTLQLSSSDPAISVPGSVTIPAGSLGVDVNVTVGPAFDKSHAFSITATDGIKTSTAVGSVAVVGGSVGLLSGFSNAPFRALLPGQTPIDFGFGIESRGGYQTTVTVHCENLPPGVTCQFGSANLDLPAGGSNATSLVLNVAAPLPVGTYTFNAVASDASISTTATGSFQIGDFGIQFDSAGPSALTTGFETFFVDLNSLNNYQGVVNVTCSGLPAGASCQTGTGVFGSSQSVVTGFDVQTTNVPAGDYPFVINGETGFTTHGVNAILHVGDFNITSALPSGATLSVGQSTTFGIALNETNGVKDQVTLSCGATVGGQPTGAVRCVVSPATPNFDASGIANSQVTVTALSRPTTSNVTAIASAVTPRWLTSLTLTVLLVGTLVAAPTKHKSKLILGCICLLTLSVVVACGGGGGGGPTPTPTPVQPPQPQTVTVTIFGETFPPGRLSTTKALGTFNVTVQ